MLQDSVEGQTRPSDCLKAGARAEVWTPVHALQDYQLVVHLHTPAITATLHHRHESLTGACQLFDA